MAIRGRISLADDRLLVELIRVERIRQYRLAPRWTRVEMPASPGGLVSLESRGTRVEVRRFLTAWEKRERARELRRTLTSEN